MHEMIAFQSHASLSVGETYSVSLDGVSFRFRAEHVRQLPDGEYLIVGNPLQRVPERVLHALNGKRGEPRVPAVVRTMSRDLPGYQAVTVDLSQSGLQLATRLPLEIGERISVSIDLPQNELLVHSRIEVMWTRSNEGRYLSGCRFVDPNRELLEAVKAFLRPRFGRLPEKRPEDRRQSIPVDAHLVGYQVSRGKAELSIRFAQEGERHFVLEPLVAVDDRRSEGEAQVGFLEHWKKGSRERWCLLNSWKEELVCFETSPRPAFLAVEAQ